VKSFKDWKIRSKLVLPLFVIVVLGGGGIISVFAGMYDEITNDTLPEERALDGIRRASLELLVEYREFMLVPSDSTQLEIEELKNEIEVYEAAFGKSALHEEYEAPFVETIEAAEQNLKRQGDKAIAVRLRSPAVRSTPAMPRMRQQASNWRISGTIPDWTRRSIYTWPRFTNTC
jgi:hypothetical protein